MCMLGLVCGLGFVFWFSCGCFGWVLHNFLVCVLASVFCLVVVLVCSELWVLRNPCWFHGGFYVEEVVGASWRASLVQSFGVCADVQFFSIAPSIKRNATQSLFTVSAALVPTSRWAGFFCVWFLLWLHGWV